MIVHGVTLMLAENIESAYLEYKTTVNVKLMHRKELRMTINILFDSAEKVRLLFLKNMSVNFFILIFQSFFHFSAKSHSNSVFPRPPALQQAEVLPKDALTWPKKKY